jgi:hypothetical protein
LRAIRGRFVAACALLVLGGLLILLNSRWRDPMISPGPLTHPHAQLLADDAAKQNCAACHAAGERSVAGWSLSLVGFHGAGANQSSRCMECHKATISEANALAAHGVAADKLRAVTESAEPSPSPSLKGRGIGEYACSTCHREHQGARFDLAAMDDGACQSCHRARYASFATDHPDFGAWPYVRRTRIAFNHASHQAKHFAEKKQTFDCRSCHFEDATKAVQLTASYEKACASCHDEKLAASVARGVPMFALPTLDVEALKAAGHEIGEWPEGATGDFDGALPPVMKLLLASDPAARKAFETLGADFEFIDVDPDDSEQLAACATLANAIRELVGDIERRGPVAVRERLSATLGGGSEVPAVQLIAGLNEQMLGRATGWLGITSSDEPWPLQKDFGRPTRFDSPGKWTVDDATLTIRYLPTAHADPVLAGWLDVSGNTARLESRPIALAMFNELAKPTAPGTCASCHSVERGDDGRLAAQWRVADRENGPRTLTKFSHGPHVMLPQLADCTSCHTMNGTADTSTSYASHDPHAFVSEFAAMSKRQCASCHTAKLAGDSCQKCHHYHVDVVEAWRGGSRRGAEKIDFTTTTQRTRPKKTK